MNGMFIGNQARSVTKIPLIANAIKALIPETEFRIGNQCKIRGM